MPARGPRPRRVRPRVGDDSGAAVVDFVMMSVLLLMLLFGVLQVAVYFYARNVAAASAADAARYAAAEGIDPADGGARARALDPRRARRRRRRRDHVHRARRAATRSPGLAVTTVHCRGRIRLLFSPLQLPLTIDVTSSVLREGVR